MNFGLSDNSLNLIINAVSAIEKIDSAYIFGSRAMGNYKPGSDVDLVVKGNDIDYDTISELSLQLNELLPLPYFFDVLSYDLIESAELRKHIDEYAKILFARV